MDGNAILAHLSNIFLSSRYRSQRNNIAIDTSTIMRMKFVYNLFVNTNDRFLPFEQTMHTKIPIFF